MNNIRKNKGFDETSKNDEESCTTLQGSERKPGNELESRAGVELGSSSQSEVVLIFPRFSVGRNTESCPSTLCDSQDDRKIKWVPKILDQIPAENRSLPLHPQRQLLVLNDKRPLLSDTMAIAATGSALFLDTIEGETALLRAVISNRLIGPAKNFAMVSVMLNLKDSAGQEYDKMPPNDVWRKVGTFWDLDVIESGMVSLPLLCKPSRRSIELTPRIDRVAIVNLRSTAAID